MKWVVSILLLACAVQAFSAEISGRIYIIKDPGENDIRAGYVGLTSRGEQVNCFAGTTTGAAAASVWCTTYKPRKSFVSWAPDSGCTYRHTSLKPGKYLVYVQRGELYVDWKVVKIASPSSNLKANFSANPASAGDLRISWGGSKGDYNLRVSPLDSKSRSPLPGADLPLYMGVDVDVTGNGTVMRGLKAGNYLLELRAADRQGSEREGYFTIFTDIGSWHIKAEPGVILDYRLP